MLSRWLFWSGNGVAALAVLTPVVCLLLSGYLGLFNLALVMFLLCGAGGLVFTILGAFKKSHQLFLQGVSGLGVFLIFAGILYTVTQAIENGAITGTRDCPACGPS